MLLREPREARDGDRIRSADLRAIDLQANSCLHGGQREGGREDMYLMEVLDEGSELRRRYVEADLLSF